MAIDPVQQQSLAEAQVLVDKIDQNAMLADC